MRTTPKIDFLFMLVMLFSGLLQAVYSPCQTAPLRIDAYTGTRNQRNKPRATYPKQARLLHIDGKVELELTISPKGGVISERVISGPAALQQSAIDAFRKVKYNPFLRDGKPAFALVQALIAYESHNRAAFELNSEPLGPEDVSSAATGGHRADYAEILSDTQGVDFGRYLQRVVQDVRSNWYRMIPEAMEMKKGTVSIEFTVSKYGKIGDMKLAAESGTVPLDRAAWGAIAASDPLPPLPEKFGGAYLTLRLRFSYNLNKSDLK